jgi:hypothetical protein
MFSSPFNWALAENSLKTPAAYFGFEPGTDRQLFEYDALINYLRSLEEQSPRVRLDKIGETPLGKPLYLLFLSSAENIKNLPTLKTTNRRLALEDRIPEGEREQLIRQGRVFLLATLSMHSDEVGPTQALPSIAYSLATTMDPEILRQLQEVVLMIVPNHNPDGMDMVLANYRKYRNTPFEGCSMPGVYHKYVGHDNNRDFVTLTQSDTRAIARIYNLDWFPQVMIEKHQMGSSGPRYFVPPAHDPIAENVDAGIWTWTGIFGSGMAKDLASRGLGGVAQRWLFDDYWPGSTETCIWKNVIGMLTECASVKDATPVYVEPNELEVGGKGLSEYKKSSSMPLPWPGGWWRLSDIVRYEITSTLSLLKTASQNREEILRFRNDLCRSEVKRGRTQPPYYFHLPRRQHDPGEWAKLVRLLQEHGIQCSQATKDVWAGDDYIRTGDVIVPLAQPFRAFAKEVLEKQVYPLRHYTPEGKIVRPYDVTSWSLPLHAGVKARAISVRAENLESSLKPLAQPFQATMPAAQPGGWLAFPPDWNDSYHAAFAALAGGHKVYRISKPVSAGPDTLPPGSFLIENSGKTPFSQGRQDVLPLRLEQAPETGLPPLSRPRIALVETFFHDMDAGWTRFLFDSYGIPFEVVRPAAFKDTDFKKKFDVVVFPDVSQSMLMDGKYKSENQLYLTDYPPEYAKGIGKEGMKPLLEFLEEGGIVVAWGQSCDLFMGTLTYERSKDSKDEFQLPVKNVADELRKKEFYCPNSLVRVQITPNHPLTYGMEEEAGVLFEGRPVFQTSQPVFDMDRRVIGRFPEKEILLSGYCEKEELVGNKSAMVWLKKGKGQLILFAFSPQFRASTPGTYKLLFNSLLLPKL